MDDSDARAEEPRPDWERYTEGADRQQFLVRRLIAVGIGVLLVILIVLGLKSCFDARKERAFKNYVKDVRTLTTESDQISRDLFKLLDDPGNRTELQFESELKSSRSAAEALVSRAEKLDAPDEMSRAKSSLVLTMELRRDGLKGISSEVKTALGREGAGAANKRIADDMQAFLASDVIYRDRVEVEMNRALREQGIGVPPNEGVPKSKAVAFLPSLDWLEASKVSSALGQVQGAGGGGAATPGVHGLGLVDVIALPSETALAQDGETTLQSGTEELQVNVQNQGESDEQDVAVRVSVDGKEQEETISRIATGESASVNVPVSLPSGTSEVEVVVDAVPGEKVKDNNRGTFSVTVG